MKSLPFVFAISGSASINSSNLTILHALKHSLAAAVEMEICEGLRTLPHFSAELTLKDTPAEVVGIRKKIESAAAVIICTPEYVFSIPSGLKNLIEWCVSTTVFSDKPVFLITASAHGLKAKEELDLLMRTLGAKFDDSSSILIQSVKAKTDVNGNIIDAGTRDALMNLTGHMLDLLGRAEQGK